jgi:hypothetical protein
MPLTAGQTTAIRLEKNGTMYHTEIHIKGKINPDWSDWFGELQIRETPCDETLLMGELPDMAAVYGVISRLGSLVIPLVSVRCEKQADAREG